MVYLCYATLACSTTCMPYLGIGNIEEAMPIKGDGDTAAAVGVTLGTEDRPAQCDACATSLHAWAKPEPDADEEPGSVSNWPPQSQGEVMRAEAIEHDLFLKAVPRCVYAAHDGGKRQVKAQALPVLGTVIGRHPRRSTLEKVNVRKIS